MRLGRGHIGYVAGADTNKSGRLRETLKQQRRRARRSYETGVLHLARCDIRFTRRSHQRGTAARGVCARPVLCGEWTTARRCERCVARRCCSGTGADVARGTSESELTSACVVEFEKKLLCELNVYMYVTNGTSNRERTQIYVEGLCGAPGA